MTETGSILETTRAGNPRTEQTDRRPWAVARIVVGVILFFAFDAAVFDSGYYFGWVSPNSGVGYLLTVMRAAEGSPGARGGVLVFGNSRMAEGFSAKLADAEAMRLGYSQRFFNSSVPSTSPRVWYYMLRAYRDRGLRPAAVVFMAESLNDGPGLSNPDTMSDLSFLAPLVGWKDIATFPLTFRAPAARLEALEALLFKGWLLHGDIEDFLLSPGNRVRDVRQWLKHGGDYLSDYPGRQESLAGLTLDPATGAIGFRSVVSQLSPALLDYLEGLREGHAETPSAEAAHVTHFWFSAASDLCRDMEAKLIVFRAPRGPMQFLARPAGEAHGALADLALSGDLRLMNADMFDDLERPELFFDEVHLNHTGRQFFSPKLAREVLRILGS